jgi:hypothetical protein
MERGKERNPADAYQGPLCFLQNRAKLQGEQLEHPLESPSLPSILVPVRHQNLRTLGLS